MLKPLPENTDTNAVRQVKPVPEFTRTCEACGKTGLSPDMINVIIVVGSPGHASLSPFQCAHEEHWACSPECWEKVAHACISEHMVAMLNASRASVGLPAGS